MLSSLYSPHILKTDEKYKETWFFNVPTLRFNSFQGEWKKERIGNYIKEVKLYTSDFDKYPLFTFSVENGVTPKTDRYERGFLVKKDGDTFKVIKRNQFLMNPMNLRFGAINYSKVENPVSVSGYYDIFEIDEMKNNDFWYGLLSNNKAMKIYNSIATGSLIEKKRVHFSQLINTKFYLPSFDEREKISHLLELINFRIDAQSKIIEEFNSLRKTIINQLIKRSYLNNNIVFVERCVTDYTDKTVHNNEYPVLSSTASGIFFQNEYFKKEASSEDTTGYKKVPYGYCTYRSMSDTGRFFFNIQKITDIGIVSPAYPVFLVKESSALFLITILNNDDKVINAILKQKAGGTRFSLPFKKLCRIQIPWPSKDERDLFMNFVSFLDKKLEVEKEILAKYIEQKNYLLFNLFI